MDSESCPKARVGDCLMESTLTRSRPSGALQGAEKCSGWADGGLGHAPTGVGAVSGACLNARALEPLCYRVFRRGGCISRYALRQRVISRRDALLVLFGPAFWQVTEQPAARRLAGQSSQRAHCPSAAIQTRGLLAG